VNAPGATGVTRFAGRRYLLRWRGIDVAAYTAMLYLGCVAGVFTGAAVAGSFGLDQARVAMAMIVLLIPALAGARIWYVAEHWSAFRREPRRIWRRSEGGSALYGGLLLSLAVSIPILAVFAIPYWTFWDAAAFTMLVGLIFTRMGCLMNGCCAGRPTTSRMGIRLPDHRGVWERRVPTPLLEAGWAAVVLVGAVLMSANRPFAGVVLIYVLAAYGAGRVLLETTRAEAGSRGSWVNIVVSALLLTGGTIVLVGSVLA
jgi:phosphatidylglycerol---prolipoprotein diacylglyceryl transferase